MNSHTSPQFSKLLGKLPDRVRQAARQAYRQFKLDPYHPSLHFKQIHTVKPIYSVRINVDYRALGIRKGDTIIWFWIGSHSDYDKLVSGL